MKAEQEKRERRERERQERWVERAARDRVSVNYFLQFGMEPVNVKSINKFQNVLLVSN